VLTGFQLDVPDFGEVVSPPETKRSDGRDTNKVLLYHIAFRTRLYPDEVLDGNFYEKCAAEVGAISTVFPYLRSEALRICFAAWLSFACAMDDI
jgi:hypothetical protein